MVSDLIVPRCEADCENLAINDPRALIAAFPRMEPTLLTFGAEYLGQHAPSSVAVPTLLALLTHEKAYVREGAVLGLHRHLHDPQVRDALEAVARDDASPGVRDVARDSLETD